MKLVVERKAALWYKREMSLEEGDRVRIFVRLGGCGSVQPGFSLGLTKDTPRNPALEYDAAGISFYIEEDNLWYLDGKELHILLDEEQDDIRMEARG